MVTTLDYDVVIVGAGLSGINSAYRIQSNFPGLTYCIIEAREEIGGTWSLFKYPGIRSDSDLFTFGFQWYPWHKNNPIATADSILEYLHEASSKFGIDKHIQFKSRVQHAAWSSDDQEWTLRVDREDETVNVTAKFAIFGTGYYDYNNPLEAAIPGIDNFEGQTIHPQFWPEDLDYTDKKIVVIGSGATAITLIPNLADKAKMVTMLQRTPSYIAKLPNRSGKSMLDYILPRAIAIRAKRLAWILLAQTVFTFCTTLPAIARFVFKIRTKLALPKNIAWDPHFKPPYNPWEQRLCLCPDGDFYQALKDGSANVATGTIKTVKSNGIELNSGEFLDADIIVTATGLRILMAGGTKIEVDGKEIQPSDKFMWRGVMLQDVPNAAFVLGYTNASWTLGADATATMVVRLLQIMETKGYASAVARLPASGEVKQQPMLNLKSTYLQKAIGSMPKAAISGVWGPRSYYLKDNFLAKHGSLQGLEWTQNSIKKGVQ